MKHPMFLFKFIQYRFRLLLKIIPLDYMVILEFIVYQEGMKRSELLDQKYYLTQEKKCWIIRSRPYIYIYFYSGVF